MSTAAAIADPSVLSDPPHDAAPPDRISDPSTLADLMTPAVGVFGPQVTVREATEALLEQVKSAFITYLYVVDPGNRLLGLVVMREMLLAGPDEPLESLMLTNLDPLLVQLPPESPWLGLARGFSLLNFWTWFLLALGWRIFSRGAGWLQSVVVALLPSVIIYGIMAAIALAK